jgi:hypothetical protein
MGARLGQCRCEQRKVVAVEPLSLRCESRKAFPSELTKRAGRCRVVRTSSLLDRRLMQEFLKRLMGLCQLQLG